MGTTVYHLRDQARPIVLDAMDAVLKELGFIRDVAYVLGQLGPRDIMDYEVMLRKQPLFFVSDTLGEWVAVLQAHDDLQPNAPDGRLLSKVLSQVLECTLLTLRLGQDDAFSYTLEDSGHPLEIPGSLAGLAPEGVPYAELTAALEPAAFSTGRDRLIALATRLRLHGELPGEYPLVDWKTSRTIPWTRFFAVSYFFARPRGPKVT